MVGNMKPDKFTIDDIVFFKNGENIVKTKIEYITYSKTGDVSYSVAGFTGLFSRSSLFSTFYEAFGGKLPNTQLF